MLDKLTAIEEKYHEINSQLSDAKVIADQPLFQKLAKAHSSISELVETFQEYKRVQADLATAIEMLEDESGDSAKLLKAEIEQLESDEERLTAKLKLLLAPKDPNDEKNVIIEIRAGTGGEEAALFAGDLFRMYTRYAESLGWRVELLSGSGSDLGGFKEIIFMIEGDQVYSRLKFESGVHRVQRVPETEASGRIHTSTVTVAVLPEVEEVEVEINPADLQIDTHRASGAGGQHVNKTDSAVRITHIPTGIVVQCQSERSQISNRASAEKILKARLLDLRRQEQEKELANLRGDQQEIAWGSQIRSYVFHPYTMVKDHRTKYETGNVQAVMDGDITGFMEAWLKARAAGANLSADEADDI